jgi:hypothetical protein
MQSLSPEQVRLVLRRAAEIERRPDTSAQASPTVAERDVAEIAAEVGIAPEAVRHALTELRAGIMPSDAVTAPGFLDKLVGPGEVVATRTVRGPASAVRAEIERFMESQLLEIKRNLGERGQVWVPAGDLWSRMKRVLDITQRVSFEQGTEVTVVVVPSPASEDEVIVRMSVRLYEVQRSRGWTTALGAAGGAAIAGAGIALFGTAPAEIAAVVTGAVTAAGTLAGVRSGHRKELERAEAALLRLLDRLEYER